jgi:hypothetical protein
MRQLSPTLSSIVDFNYHTDLLDLLARYKVLDRCSATTILPVLKATHIGVGEMLASKRAVQSYDEELRGRLLAEPRHAEHLIRKHLEKDARRLIHLPASFTRADARTLLDQYLDSDDANPNFVELIATAPTTKVTGIDAKLKLKAKRKYDSWTEDFFKNNTGIESGCEVSISDISRGKRATLRRFAAPKMPKERAIMEQMLPWIAEAVRTSTTHLTELLDEEFERRGRDAIEEPPLPRPRPDGPAVSSR